MLFGAFLPVLLLLGSRHSLSAHAASISSLARRDQDVHFNSHQLDRRVYRIPELSESNPDRKNERRRWSLRLRANYKPPGPSKLRQEITVLGGNYDQPSEPQPTPQWLKDFSAEQGDELPPQLWERSDAFKNALREGLPRFDAVRQAREKEVPVVDSPSNLINAGNDYEWGGPLVDYEENGMPFYSSVGDGNFLTGEFDGIRMLYRAFEGRELGRDYLGLSLENPLGANKPFFRCFYSEREDNTLIISRKRAGDVSPNRASGADIIFGALQKYATALEKDVKGLNFILIYEVIDAVSLSVILEIFGALDVESDSYLILQSAALMSKANKKAEDEDAGTSDKAGRDPADELRDQTFCAMLGIPVTTAIVDMLVNYRVQLGHRQIDAIGLIRGPRRKKISMIIRLTPV
ncbi:hypothetical protein TWF696_004408 [Orbilia brochopaga]|uniref:Uncharacterized protein n=1 Tax=Orbilia brochopaga TaxID=3140254 RepID=A0AAV9V802_9PEZI